MCGVFDFCQRISGKRKKRRKKRKKTEKSLHLKTEIWQVVNRPRGSILRGVVKKEKEKEKKRLKGDVLFVLEFSSGFVVAMVKILWD